MLYFFILYIDEDIIYINVIVFIDLNIYYTIIEKSIKYVRVLFVIYQY